MGDQIIVNQIVIDEQNRQSISKENPFFEDLYDMINSLLTQDGMQFSQFNEKVNAEFPSTIDMYDQFLRERTTAYTIELGKIQELPKEEIGPSTDLKMEQ